MRTLSSILIAILLIVFSFPSPALATKQRTPGSGGRHHLTRPVIKPMISAQNILQGLKSPARSPQAKGRSYRRVFGNTFVVTNTNDSGAGSFRRAIENANQSIGSDLISFNISGRTIIQPHKALPIIQDAVVIDGTTQPGMAGRPLVQLDGSLAGKNVNGLMIWANNCAVRGLSITGFIGARVANADSEITNGTGIAIIGGSNNLIEGNYLGLDGSGYARQGNDFGVSISGNSTGNIIGGLAAAAQNRIAGNNYSGIYISPDNTGGNVIQGNLIGYIYIPGTYEDTIGNGQAGIYIQGRNDTIGGTAAEARNIISGNKDVGIALDSLATGNVIYGNYIGTGAQGKYGAGNMAGGVWVDSVKNNLIAGNVISGNDGAGVYIANAGATGNRIVGNYIGTDAACTSPVANYTGVVIDGAFNNTIGGTSPGQRNVISGNTTFGIQIWASAAGNIIQGNIIGTDPTGYYTWGNGYDGIIIIGSHNTIGGTSADAGNIIWYNKGAGIYDTAGNGNLFRMNSIFSNGDLGIDLAPPGVNANTPPGGILGPNNSQNYPDLDSIAFGATYDTIYGRLNSQPNQFYIIDFYSSSKGNPTGYGEGKDWIDSLYVGTGSDGNVSFKKVLTPAQVGHELSATATDQAGNTSEFSLDLTGVSIKILKPLRDSLFVAGKRDTIQWRSPQVDTVDIFYTTDATKTPVQYVLLATKYPAHIGYYIWDPVPADILSRKCQILIRSSKNQEIYSNSDIFRIKPYVLTRIGVDGNYIAFAPNVDGWRFDNSDESLMWPQSWWQNFNYTPTGTDPNTGMFYPAFFSSFPLYAEPSDFIDWPLFVDAFTREQCFYPNHGIGSFNYNEWAIEEWRSDKHKWHGSCAGMATTCFLTFDGFMKPPGNARSLFQYMGPDDDTRKLINKYYIYQYAVVQQSYIDAVWESTPGQTISDLITMFNSDIRSDRVLALRTDKGGHAVNPCRFGEGTTTDSIFIYDSNYPGDLRYITVDKTPPRTWHYTFEPGNNWSAAGQGLTLKEPISIDLMFPLLIPQSGQTLSAAKMAKAVTSPAMMAYNSTNASVRITNTAGDSMGYDAHAGKWFSSMSSGHPIIPEDGIKQPPIGYYLPVNAQARTYTAKMKGFTDSLVHFAVFTDSAVYSYHRSDGDSTQTDNVTFGDGLRFFNKDPQTKKLLLNAIAHTGDAEHCFKISNYSAGTNDSLHLRIDKQTELVLRNFGSSKVYNMDIIDNTPNGGKKYTRKNIALDTNSSQRVIPTWNGLDTQRVKVLFDHGNKGVYDDSALISLNNQPSVLGHTPFFDLTFGDLGTERDLLLPGDYSDYISSVAIQSNGKILVGGTSLRVLGNGDNWAFVVGRFNNNGALDTTFGTKGSGRTHINGVDSLLDVAYAMVLQPDGKIVLVGSSTIVACHQNCSALALARFDSNGNIDNTFGNNGTVRTNFSGGSNYSGPSFYNYSAAIQRDGKIVVAWVSGTSTTSDTYKDTVAVARISKDGTLDASFGPDGGIFRTPIYGWVNYGPSVAIQPDGKIVVAGTTYLQRAAELSLVVARYDTNGTPDTTFGSTGGSVRFSESGIPALLGRSAMIQSDGKIVVTGIAISTQWTQGFGAIRLNQSGTVDSTFGTLGLANIKANPISNSPDMEYFAVLQPDDKIVEVGEEFDSNGHRMFGIARFAANGFPDTTFGINGSVVTHMGDVILDECGGRGAAIQSDSKIVVVGWPNITLARYMSQTSFIVEGVRRPQSTMPAIWNLNQNYPNPFNPATTIRYQLMRQSKVRLQIYNILGQLVATLVDGIEQAGSKEVIWNARNVASGVYFYRLEAASMGEPVKTFSQVKKMVLIK